MTRKRQISSTQPSGSKQKQRRSEGDTERVEGNNNANYLSYYCANKR